MNKDTIVVIVCALYFLTMVGTGIYASRKNKKASRFPLWQDVN